MKHKHANRILSRSAHHRRSLLQGLTTSLLEHGSIKTTEAKAKELRRWFEPLVTEAKQELTLARRRQLLRDLRQPGDLARLVTVAQANLKRPGGYMRLTKLPTGRHDGAKMVRVDIIDQVSA